MAKNNPYGDNHRHGAVRNRTQFYNPKTGLYCKRDKETGRIMEVKTSSNTKFKGVIVEK